jgi:hypothetical protein
LNIRIQPYEFFGQEYKFLEAVRLDQNLGPEPEALMRCLLGKTITLKNLDSMLIKGQEKIIRELATEYGVTLPC